MRYQNARARKTTAATPPTTPPTIAPVSFEDADFGAEVAELDDGGDDVCAGVAVVAADVDDGSPETTFPFTIDLPSLALQHVSSLSEFRAPQHKLPSAQVVRGASMEE